MTSDPAKLDALESTIVRLSRELAEVRRELAAVREESAGARLSAAASPPVAAPIAPPPPTVSAPIPSDPPRRSARAPARHDGGMEELIGRYGALVLAALTIMMGAGALVSWAITHGLLGPETRVALGALLAIVTAVVGFWLRARGSRELGNAVVALSLAIVHVVAWGAGPRLGIVPAWVSLTVADVASVALAVLALIEDEELLYATGLGGALISPFVMTHAARLHGVAGVAACEPPGITDYLLRGRR